MNGMPHTVNRQLRSISANFSRSAAPVNRMGEGVRSQQGLYTSYTYEVIETAPAAFVGCVRPSYSSKAN